jgi:hypothetical protein
MVVSAKSEGDQLNSSSIWEIDSFLCCLQYKVKQEEQSQVKCVRRLWELCIKERNGRPSSHHLYQNRSIVDAAASEIQPDRFVSFQQGLRRFPDDMLLPSCRLEMNFAVKRALNKLRARQGGF